MSTEENKDVVRRFITEVLEGGNLDTIDEVLAPNYMNTAMGGTDLAGFKAMLPAMGAVISGMRLDIADLVAEGDAVVARVTSEISLVNGKKIDGWGKRGVVEVERETRFELATFCLGSPDLVSVVAQA